MNGNERVDVVIVGSGPTGAAYARTLRSLLPDLRIVMLESGPVLRKRPGLHISSIEDGPSRHAAEIASQGPTTLPYAPVDRSEWAARISGGVDLSLLRRPGLFVANADDAHAGGAHFAGFAAANIGGMGAHWTGGCPRPARSEYPDLFSDEEMDELLGEAERMLAVVPQVFAEDAGLEAMIQTLAPVFSRGRPPERSVRPMPLSATLVGDEMRTHGTDIILGEMLLSDSAFILRPNCTGLRIVNQNGRASAVEVHDRLTDKVFRINCAAVVVAADSLHGPQLLYSSGIRPPALGLHLNEHFQASLLVELEGTVLPKGMVWIPYLGESFPFSVTIGGANKGHMPFDRPVDGALAFVSVFCAGEVIADNRVRFSDDKADWRGLPQLSVDLRLTETDHRTLAAARELTLKVAEAIGRPLFRHTPVSPPMGSSLHYQGTLRMGASRMDSVSDRDSRVWGFDNVYVAGNGVLPTATATNPTLMSVSLAIAGARALSINLQERRTGPATQGGLDA